MTGLPRTLQGRSAVFIPRHEFTTRWNVISRSPGKATTRLEGPVTLRLASSPDHVTPQFASSADHVTLRRKFSSDHVQLQLESNADHVIPRLASSPHHVTQRHPGRPKNFCRPIVFYRPPTFTGSRERPNQINRCPIRSALLSGTGQGRSAADRLSPDVAPEQFLRTIGAQRRSANWGRPDGGSFRQLICTRSAVRGRWGGVLDVSRR